MRSLLVCLKFEEKGEFFKIVTVNSHCPNDS